MVFLQKAVTDFESGNIEFAIVGIGLNLYVEQEQFPKEASRKLPEESTKMNNPPGTADRNRLAAQIVNYLLEETRELKLSEEYVEHNIDSKEMKLQLQIIKAAEVPEH